MKQSLFVIALLLVLAEERTVVDKCFNETSLQLCNDQSDYYDKEEMRCCWVQKKLKDKNATKADECMFIDYTEDAISKLRFELRKNHSGVSIECSSECLLLSVAVILVTLCIV